MKQVLQSFKTGELSVTDVPPPQLRSRGMLVRNAASLVSAGTERMVVDFAEKNLLQKAQARPDLVRQVMDKVQREGLLPTIDSIRSRLEQALPLGYSSAGKVTAVGDEGGDFRVGDRVACAGGGYASHAEMVYIPRNMAVKLPDDVSYEAAAFTTVGAIALQGVRLAEVVLGHRVLVIGLGLIGQLTVQLLKAAGCEVMGIDLDQKRVDLALKMGATAACTNEQALSVGAGFTHRRGFDAILITAATKSNEPLEISGELARDRGIVVAVGAIGMTIPRKPYYEKELDFRISRSYGPGRYDPEYEENGHDYPLGYVRWTQQRNMEAFVQLLSSQSLHVEPLITHRYPIDEATSAYDVITGKTEADALGVLLTYDVEREMAHRVNLSIPAAARPTTARSVRLGVIGAGVFASNILLPAMNGIDDLEMTAIMSGAGVSARHNADRFEFAYCTSDLDEILNDERINWLAIVTRHNLHAELAIAAMHAGKHVFVEKPLALNREELSAVIEAQQQTGRSLMVGFNRRFAPMVVAMHEFLSDHQRPLIATYRVNAGYIPPTHWTQDPAVGGGRIIGEGCHFLDLLMFLVGSPPTQVQTFAVETERGAVPDEVMMQISFADGSIGNVIYAAGGDKAFGKERIEVIGDGKVAILDDFRSLELVGNGKRQRQTARLRTTKGHREEWEAIVEAVKSGRSMPISIEDIVTSHLLTFAAADSLQSREAVVIDREVFWAGACG